MSGKFSTKIKVISTIFVVSLVLSMVLVASMLPEVTDDQNPDYLPLAYVEPQFLAVEIVGKQKLNVNEIGVYTAKVLNGTSPFTFEWSISPNDNFTVLEPNGETCSLTFVKATEKAYSLEVVMTDSTGRRGYDSLAVYDPYDNPALYLNAFGAPYSYMIQTDGKGWYQAINGTDGSISWSSTNPNSTIQNALDSGGTIQVLAGDYGNCFVNLVNGTTLIIQKGAIEITTLPSYQLTATLIDYQNSVIKVYTNGQVVRTYLNSYSQTIFNNQAQSLPNILGQTISGLYQPIDCVYNPDTGEIAVVSCFNPALPALTILNASTLQFISNISFPITLQPYRIKYDGINYWISTSSEAGTNNTPASLVCVNPYTFIYTNYTFPDQDTGFSYGNALEFANSPTTGKEFVFIGLGSTISNYTCQVAKFDPETFPSAPLQTVDIRNTDLGNYANQVREIVNDGNGYVWAFGDTTYITRLSIDDISSFQYFYQVQGYEYSYLSPNDGLPTQFSACRGSDSYIYVGFINGSIAKLNPITGAFSAFVTLATDVLVHTLQALPNGFIFAQLWNSPAVPAYYINTATMTVYATPQTFTCAHSLTMDDKGNIYIIENANEIYNNTTPASITRYPIQTPTGINGTLIMP